MPTSVVCVPPIQAKPVPASSVHLDAVRGVAALVVFLGHGTYLYLGTSVREQANQSRTIANADAGQSPARTHMGHQAVIIFFVLSGYFVGGGVIRAMRAARWSWKAYLTQRLTRLWVVLIPALLLTLALDTIGTRYFANATPIYAKLLNPAIGAVGSGHLSAATFFGNVFFLQGILVRTFGTNGPLWSLAYEFWYYMLFPLLMIATFSTAGYVYRGLSLLLAISVAIFCGREISFYFLIWMMGVVAYLIPQRTTGVMARRVVPLLCLTFAIFNLFVIARPFRLELSDLCTGILFTVVLWLLLHYREPSRGTLYKRAAVYLSAMSYTLYTVHYTIFVFIRAWLFSDASGRGINLHSIAILLTVYLATFFIAYLFYRCFEANTATVRRSVESLLGMNPDRRRT